MLSDSKNGGPIKRCSSTLGDEIQGKLSKGRKKLGNYSWKGLIENLKIGMNWPIYLNKFLEHLATFFTALAYFSVIHVMLTWTY